MPKCTECNKKKLFLKVSKEGLCKECELLKEQQQREQIKKDQIARDQHELERIAKLKEEYKKLEKEKLEQEQYKLMQATKFKEEQEKNKIKLSQYINYNDGYILEYNYEDVNVAGVSYHEIDYKNINVGMNVDLIQESNNAYDPNAVLLQANRIHIGYLHKGKLQDMANNSLKKYAPVSARISYISEEEKIIKIVLGFYKKDKEKYYQNIKKEEQKFLSGNHNIFVDNELSEIEITFFNALCESLKENNFESSRLKLYRMSDKTLDVRYYPYQIGRIKLQGRKTKMQILNHGVSWISDKPIETYIQLIDKWIEYLKSIKEFI